jgi:hypothetical protein
VPWVYISDTIKRISEYLYHSFFSFSSFIVFR